MVDFPPLRLNPNCLGGDELWIVAGSIFWGLFPSVRERSGLSWDREIAAGIFGCNGMLVTRQATVSTKAGLVRGTINIPPWLFPVLRAWKLPAGMKLE